MNNVASIVILLILIVFFSACSNQDHSSEGHSEIVRIDLDKTDQHPMQISIEEIIRLETVCRQQRLEPI